VDPGARHLTRPRRRVAALLAAIGCFGLSAAATASLGGLTTGRLGAENAPVASCDTDGVTLAWGAPQYNVAGRRYIVRTVTVSGIASACNGRRIRMTVAQPSGVGLTTGTVVIAGTTANITLAANANINLLTKVAVVVS
jgi:hypothetical protein